MAIKFKEGDFFKVPLKNDRFAFGRVLKNTWGFFNYISESSEADIQELIKGGYAFKVWVSDFALKKGLWEIFDNKSLTDAESQKDYFYKQDKINNKVWKTLTGAEEEPVTLEECERLELAAVYDPEHVLERLEYYFSEEGDPNIAFDKKALREKGIPTA
jgi:hypothetical protein